MGELKKNSLVDMGEQLKQKRSQVRGKIHIGKRKNEVGRAGGGLDTTMQTFSVFGFLKAHSALSQIDLILLVVMLMQINRLPPGYVPPPYPPSLGFCMLHGAGSRTNGKSFGSDPRHYGRNGQIDEVPRKHLQVSTGHARNADQGTSRQLPNVLRKCHLRISSHNQNFE